VSQEGRGPGNRELEERREAGERKKRRLQEQSVLTKNLLRFGYSL
jgi:hypothetical protein